jgi:hypothetical protein
MVEWSDFALEVKCEKCNSEVLAHRNDRGFDRRIRPVDKMASPCQHSGWRRMAA